MFALPFTPSSLPNPPGRGLLARLLSKPSPPALRSMAVAPAACMDMAIEVQDEDFPDLAQRVREVGEW